MYPFFEGEDLPCPAPPTSPEVRVVFYSIKERLFNPLMNQLYVSIHRRIKNAYEIKVGDHFTVTDLN